MKAGADVATGGIEDKRKQRKDEDFRTGNAVENSSCYDVLFLNAAEDHGVLLVRPDESQLMAAFLCSLPKLPGRRINSKGHICQKLFG